jgi:hypothetical protein
VVLCGSLSAAEHHDQQRVLSPTARRPDRDEPKVRQTSAMSDPTRWTGRAAMSGQADGSMTGKLGVIRGPQGTSRGCPARGRDLRAMCLIRTSVADPAAAWRGEVPPGGGGGIGRLPDVPALPVSRSWSRECPDPSVRGEEGIARGTQPSARSGALIHDGSALGPLEDLS